MALSSTPNSSRLGNRYLLDSIRMAFYRNLRYHVIMFLGTLLVRIDTRQVIEVGGRHHLAIEPIAEIYILERTGFPSYCQAIGRTR